MKAAKLHVVELYTEYQTSVPELAFSLMSWSYGNMRVTIPSF